MPKYFKWITAFILLAAILFLRQTTEIIGIDTYTNAAGEVLTSFGIWSVVPPLLTLVLAFTTKQVILALFAGILAGGIISANYNIVEAYMLPALGSTEYAQILLIYLWCLGGLIGLWTKTGGAECFSRWAAGHIVRGPRSAKFFAYVMGLVFHQGGTISTILAGTTVRPVCDEERVSHEELSYLIDSTASPVATVIPLNVWPTYSGAFIIGSAAFLSNLDEAVLFYWKSIPYNFFAWFALLLTLGLAIETLPWYGKRMSDAMKRSRETGKLNADGSTPLMSKELSVVHVAKGYRTGLEDFLAPLCSLILIALAGVFITGKPAVNEAFFSAVFIALLIAVMKGMPIDTAVDGFIDGCKGVTLGAIILGLAVILGSVSEKLGTAHFIVSTLSSVLPAVILPASFLLICMFVSFSTGTSLGTYAVVLPIAMPLAAEVAEVNGLANLELFMTLCFAAVIGGAVYGDRCSPISDTTILSSIATGADLMDHVYSQLPLANLAAAMAAVAYVIAALFCF